MSEGVTKRIRLTSRERDIKRFQEKSDELTKRIKELTEERDRYDRARMDLAGS